MGRHPGMSVNNKPHRCHTRGQGGSLDFLLCLTRGRKPTVMEAIGMLVMPEFFTYRSLQRMQVAVKVWQSSEAVHCLGHC